MRRQDREEDFIIIAVLNKLYRKIATIAVNYIEPSRDKRLRLRLAIKDLFKLGKTNILTRLAV